MITAEHNFIRKLEKKLWRNNFRNIFLGLLFCTFFAWLAYWFWRNDNYYSAVQYWLFVVLMACCSLGGTVLVYESARFAHPKKNPIIQDLEEGKGIRDIMPYSHKIYFISLKFVQFENLEGKIRRIPVYTKEQQREIMNGLQMFVKP